MLWSNFQIYAVEIGVLVAIVGFLFEAQRRFNKSLKADNKRHRKEMMAILDVVVEQLKAYSEQLTQVDQRLKRVEDQQKADAERLKHVEERQIKGEETTKGIGRSMSALQEDIRAIWQPAFGSFFSKKPDQGSDNHPNDS